MTGGAPCAVAVKAAPYTSTEIKPKGLGGASLFSQGYGHGVCVVSTWNVALQGLPG
jgi:hypothetical protein